MKTVKIKSASAGGVTGRILAHPQAVVGPQGKDSTVVVYEITGVPDDVTTSGLLTTMGHAIVLMDRDAPAADYVIAWDELRPRRFVRRGRYRLAVERGQTS